MAPSYWLLVAYTTLAFALALAALVMAAGKPRKSEEERLLAYILAAAQQQK